jgi:ceramide glucosyltransferase
VIAALVLLALVAGSLVYCVLTAIAAVLYKRVRPPAVREWPPISVLKPLHGVDEGLEENLVSFFEQEYPRFEMLFAVSDASDAAAAVVEKLQARYPNASSRLLVTGEPPYPNAKVYSLARMLECARHDLIVMADSDVRVGRDLLATMAAEFQDEKLGISTCPYRAVPGGSFWSALEAVGLNTEFLGGVLVARMLDGMKFAIGPTIGARRAALGAIGGFDALKDHNAEDFMMGKLAAERGYGVILSSYIVEHRIGSQGFAANMGHRLRWRRSTRRSRPWGYLGEIFTNPLPLALALLVVRPEWWPIAVAAVAFRALAVWATAKYVLRDPLTRRLWALGPLQDLIGFPIWVGGFFGNTIQWRGRKYRLLRDGRCKLIER